MKNIDTWKPSKYVMTQRGLRGSRDEAELEIGSRLVTDLVAAAYEEAIRKHASGLLLDLGCGKVPLYGVYKDYISSSVCIDWENSAHTGEWLDREHDLNQGIPLENDHFDTILLTDVLEHVRNPFLLWQEMARVLKPGGKIIIGVPFLYAIHEEPHDYFRYTEYALDRLCAVNGLRVISIEPYGGLLDTVLTMTARAAGSRRFGRQVAAIAGLVGRSRLSRMIRRKTKRRFPTGYCLVSEKDG